MRHTCIVCKRKREQKYMLKVPLDLTQNLRISKNTWICKTRTRLIDEVKEPNRCLDKYIYKSLNQTRYLEDLILLWSKRNEKYIEIEVKKDYWCDGKIKQF